MKQDAVSEVKFILRRRRKGSTGVTALSAKCGDGWFTGKQIAKHQEEVKAPNAELTPRRAACVVISVF
jgi:hypothetical protein